MVKNTWPDSLNQSLEHIHIMKSHLGASKQRIDFVWFSWGGPGSPSPPFKVGTLDRLLIALDDVGVAAVEVVDPVVGLLDCNVLDVAVVSLGPKEAGPDVLLDVVGDPQGLLEGEEVVTGGEDRGDLRDVGEVADSGGLGVSVTVMAVGRVGDNLGGVVDLGEVEVAGMGAGAAGSSADGGGVGDHTGPSILVGAAGSDGVVGQGVLKLVPVPVPAGGR
jgi:hypothetical protein